MRVRLDSQCEARQIKGPQEKETMSFAEEIIDRLPQQAELVSDIMIAVDQGEWRLFLTDEGEGRWKSSVYDFAFDQETLWESELQLNDAQDVQNDIESFLANPRRYICEPVLRFMYRRAADWLSKTIGHVLYRLRYQ
jgi:hypothetical protein